ncbi:hypothetical protein DYB34_011099 [Aphanomyces astaci]|uniref:Uncharacterized protein n=1 Tax=Aphanomyces astaci TaxID=112090 RepID=A0A418BQ19_APHAT|nr:hypothetical protein DYB34_011099 [Aphanomyces astaci]
MAFRPHVIPSEAFTPRKVHYLTLADLPRQDICLTASSIFTLSNGELEVLAWNHSTMFFDGTSPTKVEVPPREGRDTFRAGQAKKVLHPSIVPPMSSRTLARLQIDWIAHYIAHHPNLHEDDIVMYTDAWDVTIQSNMSSVGSVLHRLTNGRRGLLFNSEPCCGDSFGLPGPYGDYLRSTSFDVQLSPHEPTQRVPGPHICRQMLIKSSMYSEMGGPNWSLGSGGIVGDVKTFREFMLKVVHITNEQVARAVANPLVPLYEGDQISFQLAYPEINVIVDTRSEVFMVSSYLTTNGTVEHYDNVRGCDPDYFKDGVPSKLVWYGQQHVPMILHFPGGYKKLWASCADPMAEYLKPRSPGKHMWDVDRNIRVPIHSVCDYYA